MATGLLVWAAGSVATGLLVRAGGSVATVKRVRVNVATMTCVSGDRELCQRCHHCHMYTTDTCPRQPHQDLRTSGSEEGHNDTHSDTLPPTATEMGSVLHSDIPLL